MSKYERKAIETLINNRVCLFLCLATIMSLAIRRWYIGYYSGDAVLFLVPWYDEIKAKGLDGLGMQVGDYNILYQFIIYLFTLLPIRPLYTYKILSIAFDYALAIIVSLIAVSDQKFRIKDLVNSWKFAGVYSAVLFSPIVFLNSSCWAQCDSIFTFFIFATLYAYIKEKYLIMFILYGMAFSFKFQAIFALPFFLMLYVSGRKFSIIYFLLIPLMLVISALPGIIMGRSILEPFSIYINQTGTYNEISLNYNSFWNIIGGWSGATGDYAEFKMMATIFTVIILGMLLMCVLNSKRTMDLYRLILLLHISVYTCVLFLPSMHERYSYIYEVTAILLMFFDKKYFMYGIGVLLLSCMTYGSYLFGVGYPSLIMSLFNVIIYGGYVYYYFNAFAETPVEC